MTTGASVTTSEWSWKTQDGLEMLGRDWAPGGATRGLVVLVHGFDEHTGRYAHVGQALAAAGFAVSAYDVRGHGASGGPRVDVPAYEALLDDLGTFLAAATTRHPRLPRFLYGHSMGGNQVLTFLLRRRPTLAGAVATSPWLELAVTPPAWQLALAGLAAKVVPGLALPTGLDASGISRDPMVVRAYQADPYVRGRITPRLLTGVLQAGQWALEHAGALGVPLLLMHGEADRITSLDASRRFAARAGGLVTLRTWPGAFHELHNEPERAVVLQEVVAWLAARVAQASG